mmetsp:Transcript_112086/g.250177  ORF Transcript_112086/g.250177 Transcript_112086/m.250177 type:complete len:217 (+) Transcript_112086:328-978(+)
MFAVEETSRVQVFYTGQVMFHRCQRVHHALGQSGKALQHLTRFFDYCLMALHISEQSLHLGPHAVVAIGADETRSHPLRREHVPNRNPTAIALKPEVFHDHWLEDALLIGRQGLPQLWDHGQAALLVLTVDKVGHTRCVHLAVGTIHGIPRRFGEPSQGHVTESTFFMAATVLPNHSVEKDYKYLLEEVDVIGELRLEVEDHSCVIDLRGLRDLSW